MMLQENQEVFSFLDELQ